ncbi:hypothetical protein Psi01_19950 [Planobispora siamensis]|uniref:Uncharacterized protein n=1 Tax=Planobispora siamensis TaxID=936338 RepID=A0A8J3SDZ7_9ACTN|nr:hypothetical protein Psi01_19950 [Planobispora siamensis]
MPEAVGRVMSPIIAVYVQAYPTLHRYLYADRWARWRDLKRSGSGRWSGHEKRDASCDEASLFVIPAGPVGPGSVRPGARGSRTRLKPGSVELAASLPGPVGPVVRVTAVDPGPRIPFDPRPGGRGRSPVQETPITSRPGLGKTSFSEAGSRFRGGGAWGGLGAARGGTVPPGRER